MGNQAGIWIGGAHDNIVGPDNIIAYNSGSGIVVADSDARYNTITQNSIHDNGWTGIWILQGAHNNIVGPDNIIAYNGGAGIVVDDSDARYNTITQNSIHDNRGKGIDLRGGSNMQLAAPIIFDFNLSAGTAEGATCSDCTVEIFSDEEDEGGANIEGQTTADANGVFTFNKGASFMGPNLTATTTDVDGNTSGFSLPSWGIAGTLSLQRGNGLPGTLFLTKQSSELADNHIAKGFDSFRSPEFYDLGIYSLGVTRARVAITGIEPERVDWDRPEFSIDPSHDDVFTRMADNGLTITYNLTFWDKATYPGGKGAPCARFKTEEEIERYLEFVRFIVRHFKDRVQYFEIWNEPDIAGYCPKWIEVDDYINLVRRTVPVIREEYPEAKIVVGSVSGTRYPNAYNYLMTLLKSDIMPLVDVIAWHPMYGDSPAADKDYYYGYPAMVQRIKDTATANGFVLTPMNWAPF